MTLLEIRTLTLTQYKYVLDGGTTVFLALDDSARRHEVVIGQHAFFDPKFIPEPLPGRLYFDGEIISLRSQHESLLLNLLENARIAPPPGTDVERQPNPQPNLILGDDIKRVLSQKPSENMRCLRDELVQFVRSPRYMDFQVEIEQALDENQYTLWLDCHVERRQTAIRLLHRLLDLSLSDAKKLMDSGQSVCSNVDAKEVARLFRAFREEEISVRVAPNYPYYSPGYQPGRILTSDGRLDQYPWTE